MRHLVTLFFTLFVLTGCLYKSSTGVGQVGVDRRQLMLVPSETMMAGADEAYARMMKEAKAKHLLNRDPKELARLRTIGSRLVKQTGTFRRDAETWQWEINLITSDELNAWCMPGGKIVFYTGIIETLHLNDDEIAAIMGHEISHALREHARERSSQAMATQGVLDISAQLLGFDAASIDLASWVTNVAIMLPNSREQEREADRMGVELAARAGYDPQAAVNVWKKMEQLSKNSPPELLSTHPSNSARIKDLEVYALRVTPLYEQNRK